MSDVVGNMDDFEELVDSSKEVKATVVGGMEDFEIQQFNEYLVGAQIEPPEAMAKMMNNIITKLSMGLGYNVVNNINRQTKLSSYISKLEETLYDPADISAMSAEEKVARLDQANKTLNNLQEFQRKFIVQNKDAFAKVTSPQEKMMNQIMSMPPEKIEKMIQFMNSELETKPVSPGQADNFDL